MVQINFDGQVMTGEADFEFGLSDLAITTDGAGEPILVAVSHTGGAVAAWDISGSGLAQSTSFREAGANPTAGVAPSLMETTVGLLALGFNSGEVEDFAGNSNGGITSLSSLSAGGSAWSAGVALSDGTIVLASAAGTGFSLFDASSGFAHVDAVSDVGGAYADQISALATIAVGGRDILLVASGSENGVSAYSVESGDVTLTDSVGQDDGMGMMTPTAMETVEIDGTAFVIVGSAGGGSGALTVLTVGPDGALEVADHIMDTLNTRFGGVQALDVVPYQDGALIIAGGGDDGLSLLLLTERGEVTHLTSFEDTVQSGLTDVTSMVAHIVGDTMTVFVTSQADPGVSQFSVDLDQLGQIIELNGASGGVLGTAGDDVFVGSDMVDITVGNGGADLYVVMPNIDGGEDVINQFDPDNDRIDLSNWPMLYSVDDLNIWATGRGARVQFGDQILFVKGVNDQPIDPEVLRAVIEIDINRLPDIPGGNVEGSANNDVVEGTWGMDTLTGGAGDDTVMGMSGDDVVLADPDDDLIYGGGGTDTLSYDLNKSDVEILGVDVVEETVTITSSYGTDVIIGVEIFQFADGAETLWDLHEEMNEGVPTSVMGTSGDDMVSFEDSDSNFEIKGLDGDDYLEAGDGSDLIEGDNGNDELRGGRGDDTIFGGHGDDLLIGSSGDDVLYGGRDNDLINGRNDQDELFGGFGDDIISGQRHGDELSGDQGEDRLFGGGGNDTLYGGEGNDYVKGGWRKDTVYGGDGDDTVIGNTFDDELYGGAGNDNLNAGADNDTLDGGTGDDRLWGGEDADKFIFDIGYDHDLIRDFSLAEDRLQLGQDLLDEAMTTVEIVANYGSVNDDGILLSFGPDDSVQLIGIFDLLALAEAIDVV